MSYSIELKSGAPPGVVLDAIREELREWRESQIPREIWKQGVMQVLGKVSANEFRLTYSRRWGRSISPELSGVVHSAEAGGSVVRARCGIPRYLWVLPLAVAVVGYVLSLFDANGAFVAFLAASILTIMSLLHDSLINRSNAKASYLVTRLEHAVNAATEKQLQKLP